MKIHRQGDVLLVPIDRVPETAAPVRPHRRGLVLAEGEVTGHAHVIAGSGAELLGEESSDRAFLRVLEEAGVALTHEEHATILVPPGIFEVRRQREYTPAEIRRVTD